MDSWGIGFKGGREPWFRREGIRKQSPVSKRYSTVGSIALSSLRTQIFRAIGARLRGGLRPRSIREGKVS